MIYFIYGNQSPTIRVQIKKIAKESLKEALDEFNFVKFDGHNSLVQDVVSECNNILLGSTQKVVVLENAYFLAKEKSRNKLNNEQDFNTLINYIKNPNPDTDLIITVVTEQIDDNHAIVSLLKSKTKIISIAPPSNDDWSNYAKHCFEKANCQIDKDALQEVCSRTLMDVSLLLNTVAKLSLYTDHVTYNDVLLMVNKPLEENTFLIFNHLLNKRNDEAVRLFRDLKKENVEPVTIISLLANQFRLLNQVVFLSKKGIEKEDIAKQLNIKPGRVYILSKQTYNMSENKINQTLDQLFELDYKIKSNLVDRFYAFELFLLTFKTK